MTHIMILIILAKVLMACTHKAEQYRFRMVPSFNPQHQPLQLVPCPQQSGPFTILRKLDNNASITNLQLHVGLYSLKIWYLTWVRECKFCRIHEDMRLFLATRAVATCYHIKIQRQQIRLVSLHILACYDNLLE